jgi:glucans biosynthesis protein
VLDQIVRTILLIVCCISPAIVLATEGPPAEAPPQATVPPPGPFDFADVEHLAQALSVQTYAADTGGLPDYLGQLSYDQYRDIRFNREKSLWFAEGLPFHVQFFHRGFLYKDRVKINVIAAGNVQPVNYASELFDYGNNQFSEPMPTDMGFSGIRILHPLRKDPVFDEIAVFQGASYFRGVGLGQTYGISARGLALNTGLPRAEEFPLFKEFWIEQPAPDSRSVTVYALMDSPSATGAYRFIIQPGVDLVMEVKAHLYLRQGVERFGLAPLTSMYLHGENSDRFYDDFRPEVHDSDGLLIGMRNGEWVWRPLNNPKRLAVNVFQGTDIVGFGLMQRDRDFASYQDLEAMYHIRPSVWVEAVGSWGAGSVYLIEIPSDAEKYDNIVAFWVPERPAEQGQDWVFDYRLHFMLNNTPNPTAGKVMATRIGAALGNGPNGTKRNFVVEFDSDTLRGLSAEASIEAMLTASSGQISDRVVQKNLLTGAWRLAFEFEPDPNQDPMDFRAHLKVKQEALTETWIYQWSKP